MPRGVDQEELTKRFKILVADTDPEQAARTATQLENQLDAEVVTAREAGRAIELLSSPDFDAIVVAPVLGAVTSVDLIKEAVRIAVGVPVIMVGSRVGERAVAEAIKAGASDFVVADENGLAKIGQVVLKAMRQTQRSFLLETEEEHTRMWERMYHAAFEVSPVALAILDTEGKILAANSKSRELVGGGSPAVVGINLLDLLSGLDLDSYEDHIRDDSFPFELNAELQVPSGELAPVSIVVDKLEDLPDAFVIALVDLRKPASYRRMWEYLMRDALDMVMLIDEGGRILSTSKGMVSFTGIPEEEQLGSAFATIGHPANTERIQDLFNMISRTGHVTVENFEYRLRDGQVKYCSGSIYELVGGNHLVIWTDVTGKRKRELDLEVYGLMVAHELRTPLTAINGFVDLMRREGGLTEESLENLSGIRKSTERLEKTAQALLDISIAGDSDSPLEPVDAQGVAEEAIDILSPLVTEKEGKVVIPEKLPQVRYLKSDLHLVFSNLLSNALRYGGGEEGPLVEISWRQYPGRYVFYVKDFGPGIPPVIQDKVLVPFFKTDNSDGMGLGLSLSKRVVESHDGDLWLESWEGEGTTVYFSIPR